MSWFYHFESGRRREIFNCWVFGWRYGWPSYFGFGHAEASKSIDILLINFRKLIVICDWCFHHSLLISDIRVSHPWLIVIGIRLSISKSVFWIQWALRSETSTSQFIRDSIAFYKLYWFVCNMRNFLPFSLRKISTQIVVRLMPECLKPDKPIGIFYISELLIISPSFVVVVLHPRWVHALLEQKLIYSLLCPICCFIFHFFMPN